MHIVVIILDLILLLKISNMELVATLNNTATIMDFKNGAKRSDRKYREIAAMVIKKY